jgi:branched-chain amino acid transport system permease protein
MRAASEDPRLAALLGVSPNVVALVSWGIGGALAGAAAILVAPDIALTPDAFTVVLIQSFAAVVVGGFTSMLGAVVGGYLVGIGLNLFSFYIESALPSTFILALVLVVLVVRPHGLFGHGETVRL